MPGTLQIEEQFTKWFAECSDESEIEMLRAMLIDTTEQEYENRLYDFKI